MENSASTSQATVYESNPVALFKPSWSIFTKNWQTIVLLGLASFVTILVAVGVSSGIAFLLFLVIPGLLIKILVAGPVIAAGVVFTFWLVSYFGWTITRVLLEGSRGNSLKTSDAWPTASQTFKLFRTMLLMAVMILLGFLCFILPGIYLAIRWSFALTVAVDEQKFGWDALNRSKELVQGHFTEVAAIILATSAFGILTIVPVLGSLVYAVASLGLLPLPMLRYLQLKALPKDAQPMPVHAMNYLLIVLGLIGLGITSKDASKNQPPATAAVRVEKSV